MKRRTIKSIQKYLEPKEIFNLIISNCHIYSYNQDYFVSRDRALMAMTYCAAGRISEIVPGDKFATVVNPVSGVKETVKVGRHPGVRRENIIVKDDYIIVSGLKVVKRNWKLLLIYGEAVATRDDFIIPLKCGLFVNPYWDQLVPFGHLILNYLVLHAPSEGALFPITRFRAYQIIRETTGMFPHWFRAQAEHFYGNFLLTDSIKLAKFVKVVNPSSVREYIGYDWRQQLKDKHLGLDFDWIDDAVQSLILERKRKGGIE